MTETKRRRARRPGTPLWARIAALLVAALLARWLITLHDLLGLLELAVGVAVVAVLLYGGLAPGRRRR